jgi:DNA-binding transcriptional MerR regulator
MRIKEVESRTGLTAKAIRLYESKGLLKPARETENDYRDYTEEDVARLKTIAILRKLDVPVKTIKEWTDGETELRDILQKAADQNREASRENELRHKLAEDLAELLEKDPEQDLGEAVREIQELDEIVAELEELLSEEPGHIGVPLYSTLLSLGPVGFTMIYILDGMTEKALCCLGLSVLAIAWVTLRWRAYFAVPRAKRQHSGCLSALLMGVVLLVVTFGIMIWIQHLQYDLFNGHPTDVMLSRAELLPLFFMIEVTALFVGAKAELWKNIRWRSKKTAITAAVLVAVNLLVMQVSVMSVSVANENGITRYSMFCPDGKLTPYTEIERIETGFRGKTLGLPIKDTGEFYYEITYRNGRTEKWGESICHDEEITWKWMLWFDEWCRSGGAEKIGSDEFSEYCEMEQFYVDILIDVVNAR